MHKTVDVIVVGAGHAGCEAALAASRLGASTALVTMNLDTIAQMSCNPAIGGLAKGQLVREIDALGGAMGLVTDETGIQFRMLNTRKGPAVQSPRCQSDKKSYQFLMKYMLEQQENLSLHQERVVDVLVTDGVAYGVKLADDCELHATAVILTTGTFLKGLVHIGPSSHDSGRMGEASAPELSGNLACYGLEVARLKTGTPPRINGRTIDYSKCEEQPGDEIPKPFSFSNDKLEIEQMSCWITYTNEQTHEIIRQALDRSPLYNGQIDAVGPRYCPSIEDKVVRFADKQRHQIFLEPEGRDTLEVYCNGISTSLPKDVQDAVLASIVGLEDAQIMRYGYAIEYDYFPPTQLTSSLESKLIENVYFAGQINGTTGYEEAAAQGLMAGINAVQKQQGKAAFVLGRDVAYIGVMIDDLITKGVTEPYRMFTSRAEYRLLLRSDNADRRLTQLGRDLGLVTDEAYDRYSRKSVAIAQAEQYLDEHPQSLKRLRRPDESFASVLGEIAPFNDSMVFTAVVQEQIEIDVRYAGYIQRQESDIKRASRLESLPIPEDFDYDSVVDLRHESREKFKQIQPRFLGQASRISGVRPVDISVLMVHLKK